MKILIKKYYLFHLLNDYSGSPSVLRQVAETLSVSNEVNIVTSRSEGFLTGIPNCNYSYVNYTWSKNKFMTLYRFVKVQIAFFFQTLFLKKGSIIYVNTLLPFGAAVAGKIRGFEIVYHLHEPQLSPQKLFSFLKWLAKKTASKQIFVSKYLKEELSYLLVKNNRVIYNTLSADFMKRAKVVNKQFFQVLMACSMKKYKGIYEFLDLANQMQNLRFKLILNAKGLGFDRFCSENQIPTNCEVLPSQSDMIPHYQEASLLLNLSDRNEWVESFGLTLIEAMCHGIPVIGPEVGGPKEIIEHGKAGFCVDSKNQEELISSIRSLSSNKELYIEFSNEAKLSINKFLPTQFQNDIKEFLK